MKIYGLKDKAVGFIQIFCGNNDYHAKRNVMDTLNKDQKCVFATYPSDFELYRLAKLDEDTGEIVADKAYLGNLAELKEEGAKNVK